MVRVRDVVPAAIVLDMIFINLGTKSNLNSLCLCAFVSLWRFLLKNFRPSLIAVPTPSPSSNAHNSPRKAAPAESAPPYYTAPKSPYPPSLQPDYFRCTTRDECPTTPHSSGRRWQNHLPGRCAPSQKNEQDTYWRSPKWPHRPRRTSWVRSVYLRQKSRQNAPGGF